MSNLLCFPWERNVGKARRVAEVYLRRRSERDRIRYWGDTAGYIEWTLRRKGFSDEEIVRQLAGFKHAVEWEIETINLYNSQNGPGAA